MLGPAGVRGDERQIDLAVLSRGEFLLGLFRSFTQTLESHRILTEVDAVVLLEAVSDEVDEDFVEVVPTQVGIAVGGEYFDRARFDFEDRHVERPPAEVKHADLFFLHLFEAVCQCSGSRLVDDTDDFQTGDLTSVFGGLALGVVEVRGDGDDGLVDLMAEVVLSCVLELHQHAGRDFGGSVLTAVDVDLDVLFLAADDLVRNDLLFRFDFGVTASHEPLDRVDRVLGVRDGLPLGGLADEDVALVGECDDAGRRGVTFLVGDDLDFAPFHDRDARVGRAEVDADDLFARNSHG